MADPDIAHADIAGWVLGALDPDESERFQAHLETCDECQREVAELSPSATLLEAAAPGLDLATGPELPADLQARTVRSRRRRDRTMACGTVLPGRLLDHRGDGLRLGNVDRVAGAGGLRDGGPGSLGHRALRRRGDHPVFAGDQVPAWLDPPGGFADRSAERIYAPGDLGVGHER